MNDLMIIKKNANLKRIFKYIINLIVFVLLIWLTFYILLRNQNMIVLKETIHSAKKLFIILGLLCMFCNFSFDALNLRRTLRALGEEVTFMMTLKYTLVGFFFSSITPFATGGQPMQLYLLHKDGIKVSNATLGLVLNLFSYQMVTITLALFSFIFLHNYLSFGMKVLFAVGTIINSIALAIITVGIFSHRLSTSLVHFLAKVLKFFKVKNYEKIEESLFRNLEKYNGSAKYIREKRSIISKQFACAYIQQIIMYSVPFFVMLSLGFFSEPYSKMVGLQSIVFGATCGIPLPGAVGVSEGAFVSLFKAVFSDELINGAMILHRGISFYFPVICCAFVTLITITKPKNKKKKNQS